MKGIVNTAVERDRLLCATHGAAAIEARSARLREPHVEPLTQWVESVRDRLDGCHAETVCNFDPDGGGVEARVLFLAQDPSSTASATGFISPDNNDRTARSTTEACRAAELGHSERIHWNVYPWWIDAPCGGRVENSQELASEMLLEFTNLLPNLRSVVLIGKKARHSWSRLASHDVSRRVRWWHGPHPSYGGWSKPYASDPASRLGGEVVVEALQQARAHAFRSANQERS